MIADARPYAIPVDVLEPKTLTNLLRELHATTIEQITRDIEVLKETSNG